MPLAGKALAIKSVDSPYFASLKELDIWATKPARKLEGILPYTPQLQRNGHQNDGKLLVCHDYKGGYTERPSAISYTFNFWSSCHTFVYFSHHRVTIPPPGWITAGHRQGVKILGVLIFEPGGEEECLRLLVGNLPQSLTGPAKPTPATASLPLSSHYAKLLAELAYQRGFDGYLLNFECHLQGGVEQTRTLAAWITVLETELKARVGHHAEAIWYDSVTFTGRLNWQDRLNSLNLPFFLSSSGIFTNYTWPKTYPSLTAQYFCSLPTSLTSPSFTGKDPLTLSDIYIGIDTWGRNTHGGGGFGCYKAITHILPSSLGLSAALFGPGWTWETIQDKPEFTWEMWWANERTLWVGPVSGNMKEVEVPKAPRKPNEPECECEQEVFRPMTTLFAGRPPPDPAQRALHTTFSPGIGWGWWVEGLNVYWAQSDGKGTGGWTDIDKQCSIGDLVWPRPKIEWEVEDLIAPLPSAVSDINFDDAWNGGSSLKLTLSVPLRAMGSEGDDDESMFRCIWIPVQSLSIQRGRPYQASVVYKVDVAGQTDVEIGLSVKFNDAEVEIIPISAVSDTEGVSELPGGWSRLSIQFNVPNSKSHIASSQTSSAITAIGLIVAIVSEQTPAIGPLSVAILLGQLNVYSALPILSPPYKPMILWTDFTYPDSSSPLSSESGYGIEAGTLKWETAASFSPLPLESITNFPSSPEDPTSALPIYPSGWFPNFVYFNIYSLPYSADGSEVGQPEEAVWIGTSGVDGNVGGRRNVFGVVRENMSFFLEEGNGNDGKGVGKGKGVDKRKIRFYVQGVDECGQVMGWEQSSFVDCVL